MLHPLPPLALETLGVSPHSCLHSIVCGFSMGLVTLFLKSANKIMANISIISRQNVVEFITDNKATKLDFVKNPKTGKLFFALDNKASTKGAISKALQEEITSGRGLSVSEVVVADTVMEGTTDHVWLLMKAGESNRIGGFSL